MKPAPAPAGDCAGIPRDDQFVLTIHSPVAGKPVGAGEPFLLQGSLTDGAGRELRDAVLAWSLGGVPAGVGWTCEARSDPGITLLELHAYVDDVLVLTQQLRVMVETRRRRPEGDCDP